MSAILARVAMLRDGAGLTDAELAYLLGVSRKTLWSWRSGATAPHGRLGKLRAEFFLTALCAAMQGRLLPLPGDLTRSVRSARLGAMRRKLDQRFNEHP